MKPVLSEFVYEGFDELEQLGFTSEYIRVDSKNKLIQPAFSAEDLLTQGFLPRGSRVTYLGENGYDRDREYIEDYGIKPGDSLTVATCSVGNWNSSYTFEEVAGKHNTVMFKVCT
jgi:hypothetical protein